MRSEVPLETLFHPGLFETLKVSGGRVLALEKHLDRLVASGRSVSPSLKVTREKVRRELTSAIKARGLKEAYVRLTLVLSGKGDPFFFTIVKPQKKVPAGALQKGVAVITSATRRNHANSLSGELKVREYHNGLLAVLDSLCHAGKVFERIMLDRDGYVSEGTVTNLFILKGRTVITPPSYLGVLPGVTRGAVLAVARCQGLGTSERPFTRSELYTADEAFLTNRSLGILPVTEVDGRQIGSGEAGRWTQRLGRAYNKESG